MTTVDATLRHALEVSGRDLILTLDPALQGLPETAHGGSVLAVFDTLAGVTTPREVSGIYRRRVPLGVPLTLRRAHEDSTETFALCDQTDAILVDGRVAALGTDADDDEALSRPGGGAVAPRGPVLSGLVRSVATAPTSREMASVVPEGPPPPRPADLNGDTAPPSPTPAACLAGRT